MMAQETSYGYIQNAVIVALIDCGALKDRNPLGVGSAGDSEERWDLRQGQEGWKIRPRRSSSCAPNTVYLSFGVGPPRDSHINQPR